MRLGPGRLPTRHRQAGARRQERRDRPKRRTFGSPTTPTFKLDLNRPSIGFVTGSSFFFGGMMINLLALNPRQRCCEEGAVLLYRIPTMTI